MRRAKRRFETGSQSDRAPTLSLSPFPESNVRHPISMPAHRSFAIRIMRWGTSVRRVVCRFIVVWVVYAVTVSVSADNAAAQPPAIANVPGRLHARLDSLFTSVDSATTPGCAVGVSLANGAPSYRSYGLANLEHPVPIDTLTVFEAGSVSKQFTAAAVLLLAQEGRLSLDDPIRRWIPELWIGLPPFTVGDMLYHVSGLRDYGDLFELSGWPRGTRRYDNADALQMLARQRALNFAPRAEYAYSNSGYVLATIVVARASGTSFANYVHRAIFSPLGMTRSSWRDDYRRVVPQRAQGYTPNDSGRWTLDMPFESGVGNGGLLTTVADLMKWQARFGARPPVPIGGATFVQQMERPITLTSGRVSGYALGLEIGALKGERVVTHGGWTAGYKSYVGRVPARGTAVALLCNAGSLNTEEVGGVLLAIAADIPMASYYEEPNLGPAADTLHPGSLARLTGSYRSSRTRQAVRVRAYNDGITINSWTGYRKLTDSTFVSLDGDRRITFRFDTRRRPTSYTIREANDSTIYARVEAWKPDVAELAALLGSYRCEEADAVVEIVRQGDGLAMRRRGRLDDAMSPRYRDALTVDNQGWLLTVVRDTRGRVAGIELGGSRSRTVPCAREARFPRPGPRVRPESLRAVQVPRRMNPLAVRSHEHFSHSALLGRLLPGL
jgi:CubicO group peptidase (beta-lactamase class C family)